MTLTKKQESLLGEISLLGGRIDARDIKNRKIAESLVSKGILAHSFNEWLSDSGEMFYSTCYVITENKRG